MISRSSKIRSQNLKIESQPIPDCGVCPCGSMLCKPDCGSHQSSTTGSTALSDGIVRSQILVEKRDWNPGNGSQKLKFGMKGEKHQNKIPRREGSFVRTKPTRSEIEDCLGPATNLTPERQMRRAILVNIGKFYQHYRNSRHGSKSISFKKRKHNVRCGNKGETRIEVVS
jgi:hypothetical protein